VGEVGYIVKGFPRLSETFIANEIHLLESLGLTLRLYSIVRGDEGRAHGVIARIRAPVTYLPPVTSLSGTSFPLWLSRNLPLFVVGHVRLAVRRPRAYFSTLAASLAMSWRYRRGPLAPRKVFFKEFLQAGEIALQVLEAGTVQHLHGHYCHGAATVTWFAARLTGLPFSFTAHAKDIYKADLNPSDLLERKMRAARFVVTCTAANRAHLARVCPDHEALHIVYHGLDTDFFAPLPPPAPGSVPVILAVGRLVEKKGFEYLVAACAQLRAAGLPLRCFIVGPPGSHSAQIATLIGKLGLEDVVSVHGGVTQEVLRELYRRATLFVLPCLKLEDGDQDGIPNVLAEAMAMGLPVVSTRIYGIPELIEHGTDGVLVPERDSTALAGALRSLLMSPALRQRLAEAGRRKICAQFDSRRTTRRLYQLLADSLGAAAGATASPDVVGSAFASLDRPSSQREAAP